jgi:hypothetical protein
VLTVRYLSKEDTPFCLEVHAAREHASMGLAISLATEEGKNDRIAVLTCINKLSSDINFYYAIFAGHQSAMLERMSLHPVTTPVYLTKKSQLQFLQNRAASPKSEFSAYHLLATNFTF